MTSLKKTSVWFFLSTLLFILSLGLVGAQTQETFEIKLSPETPGPGEEVMVFVSSFSIDLDVSNISWKVNGTASKTGVGERRLTLRAPAAGEKTEIEAVVTAPTGTSVTKKISIEPLSLDLLWEASDSYVPPFYKGRALPGEEAAVAIFAIPGTRVSDGLLSPDNLTYTWTRNGNVVSNASGYGKRTFRFQMDYLNKTEEIEVEARDDKGRKVTSSLFLTPTEPFVLLYENLPLSGVQYSKAITNPFILRGAETTLTAEPYYFSPRKKGPPLGLSWLLNGKNVTPSGLGDTLTIRADSEEAGEANISVSVTNTAKILQKAISTFVIKFNQKEE